MKHENFCLSFIFRLTLKTPFPKTSTLTLTLLPSASFSGFPNLAVSGSNSSSSLESKMFFVLIYELWLLPNGRLWHMWGELINFLSHHPVVDLPHCIKTEPWVEVDGASNRLKNVAQGFRHLDVFGFLRLIFLWDGMSEKGSGDWLSDWKSSKVGGN